MSYRLTWATDGVLKSPDGTRWSVRNDLGYEVGTGIKKDPVHAIHRGPATAFARCWTSTLQLAGAVSQEPLEGLDTYSSRIKYYRGKFSDLAMFRASLLALTDVNYRVVSDGGATFSGDTKVSAHASGAVVELFPQVAVAPEQNLVFVTWQEFASGRDDDAGRIMLARFDLAGGKLGSDVRVDSGGDGFGKWTPQVAVEPSGDPTVV